MPFDDVIGHIGANRTHVRDRTWKETRAHQASGIRGRPDSGIAGRTARMARVRAGP